MTQEENECQCSCRPIEVLIFPCSGGSNVGQIANEVAKDLTIDKIGKMYCLAGIGGHISGFIESTRSARKIVAIDGCPSQCARKTLEHAGFEVHVHEVITELGIKKSYDFLLDMKELRRIEERIISQIR